MIFLGESGGTSFFNTVLLLIEVFLPLFVFIFVMLCLFNGFSI